MMRTLDRRFFHCGGDALISPPPPMGNDDGRRTAFLPPAIPGQWFPAGDDCFVVKGVNECEPCSALRSLACASASS